MSAPAREPHPNTGRALPPEHLLQVRLGDRYTEIRSIVRRINRRGGDPTAKERDRLAELKAEIAALKRGE